MNFEEDEDVNFFRQHRTGLIIIAVILGGLGTLGYKIVHAGKSVRAAPEIVMVRLPPPPPPTPPQQPTPEQKLEEEQEQKIDIPDEKPKDIPEKPPDEPPIGTGIKGDGQGDNFGLTGSGGSGFGNGNAGSRFDWYAGQVQRKVAEALRNNPTLRQATLSVRVRLWADSSGRVIRADLAESSGDPAVDAAIENQVLLGLQVSEAPPEGMPMPILLRLNARRP